MILQVCDDKSATYYYQYKLYCYNNNQRYVHIIDTLEGYLVTEISKAEQTQARGNMHIPSAGYHQNPDIRITILPTSFIIDLKNETHFVCIYKEINLQATQTEDKVRKTLQSHQFNPLLSSQNKSHNFIGSNMKKKNAERLVRPFLEYLLKTEILIN